MEEEKTIDSIGESVVIQISDNGPGIPLSIQESVFKPFYSSKEEGTGLGLSIAFNIIDEHGGWLDASSQEGQGTTFTITLPIKDSSHE